MRRRSFAFTLAALAFALAFPAAGAASPAPAWQLDMVSTPTAFVPASQDEYKLLAINVGAGATSSQTTIEATLPAGLSASSAEARDDDPETSADPSCTASPHLVTCQITEALHPGRSILAAIVVTVEAGEGALLEPTAQISGGGALQAVTATAPTRISTQPDPFGIRDFSVPANDEEGLPPAAGAHPYQLTLSMYFPSIVTGPNIDAAEHVRDIFGELPRGFLLDPAATPVLCTEAELLSEAGCPPDSQLGSAGVATAVQGSHTYGTTFAGLFNMVPPPGSPTSFGFDAENFGIFIHLLSGVRTDGDYGLYGYSSDILALSGHPVMNTQLQFWGDPSAAVHDKIRGKAASAVGKTPLLSAPAACEATPPRFEARADTWEQPGIFHTAQYESADLEGNPAPISGCNAEPFEPTISAQPSTNLADSPTGLEVDLHQPQEAPHTEPLSGRGAAPLKDAVVTLPAGMVANPSQADGLGACTEEQIGYLSEDEEAGIHFSKEAQSCPEASKLGTLEVTSPLLAEYEDSAAGADTKLATDPETGAPIPRPLEGSVYLAKPYENPFGSLLAIYLAVEDPQSGIVAKLAGRVEADPKTGQLTTVFEENPEQPLEDIHLKLFEGARAPLITPPTCGTHTTTSTLTPWSSPEGLDAHPESSFQTSAEPGGGSCPQSEGAVPNKPAFQAGTLAPQAGAYSPFVLKLSREDGSQRIAGIDTTLPPGLSGKLAGIPQCSDAQIAQAKSREKPNEGILERQSPSCPASSEVGSVDVSAGAGPTPFHTSGHAYLAGPYKGAPLSVAVIVPAVAGPFDLGAVVSRVALYLDPDTAQIHAVSDPLPQILEGIPLDVRSIALTMGRPQFTLNPTSCDPMQVTGSALSALGQSAALSNPFQVGGCQQLPFKPKLSLKLKGGTKRTGHPKLIANLKAKPGEANVASAQVKLPPSAFLDQAHIRTVCTRVQFAANACPSGSIYGTATAVTPLLSDPLTGNVYLRSSSHKLPDLVVALKGPASLPIEIDLDGKTDAVKGALRNSFEAVPDAPVSSFRLELFGGKKGLVVNSRNLCAHPYKAEVNLTGQNGKVFDSEPVVGTDCKHGRKGGARRGAGHRRGARG